MPARMVSPPASIARSRVSRRIDPAASSIKPAVSNSKPMTPPDMPFSTGSSAAPALSTIIATPAMLIHRARLSSEKLD